MADTVRRFADLVFYNPKTGRKTYYQIGRVGKDGKPVPREWDAGGDLSLDGYDVFFVPYNRTP